MECPECGSDQNKVIDSRVTKDRKSIRRRRICLHCSDRWTTDETPGMPGKRLKRAGTLLYKLSQLRDELDKAMAELKALMATGEEEMAESYQSQTAKRISAEKAGVER